MIISDASKLSYFAKAAMVRGGVKGSYGLSGLGEVEVGAGGKLIDTEEQGGGFLPYVPPPFSPGVPAPPLVGAENVPKPGGGSFVSFFTDALNNLMKPGAGAVLPPVIQQSPSVGLYIVGGVALLGGLLLVWKLAK